MRPAIRKLAAQKLSQEKPGQTLDATALVHEAYRRLVGGTDERGFANSKLLDAAEEKNREIALDTAEEKE